MIRCARVVGGLCTFALLSASASASAETPPAPPLALHAPDLPPPEPQGTKLKNPGLILGGAFAATVGLGLLGGGFALMAANDPTSDKDNPLVPALGVFAAVHGVLCVGASIPMFIVGARRVPKEPDDAGWLRPRIGVGPASVSVSWSF